MIQAQSLTKTYGSRVAISDINFHIKPGELVGFLGPNGAGKTTTMKILTGYMAPKKGKAYLDGIDVFKHPFRAKQKLGYLPEIPPLYTDMNVEDYLKYVAQLKLCSAQDIPKLVDKVIEKINLQSVRKRLIQNLSKGFKQRTGLAQALVSDPKILILDEPTVGLDPKQVIEIRNVLRQLKGQHTILLSTHILSEVQMICDRVIIINEGKIITENHLKDLNKQIQTKKQLILKVKKYSQNLISQLKSLKGVLDVTKQDDTIQINTESQNNINEDIAKIVISGSYGLLELQQKHSNLEDIFIHLTKK